MSRQKSEQEQLQMIGTKNCDQPETKTLLITTVDKYETRIVQGNRDNWSNRIVYLLSIIGFVVDLGKDDNYLFEI